MSPEAKIMVRAGVGLGAIALVAFAFQPAPPAPTAATRPVAVESPSARAIDTAAVDAMKKDLRAMPMVRDLLFQPGAGVQWQIGVTDDGSSRVGLAQSVCMMLADKQLTDAATSVRIVDYDKLLRTEGDFRGASLGHVRCKDGSDMGA